MSTAEGTAGLDPTTVHMIVFASAPLGLNLLSMLPFLRLRRGRGFADSASLLPLMLLLLTDCALSALLFFPVYNLLNESETFDGWSCAFYGSADMTFSLFEISLATVIAFDRYIVTKQPKWGTWRSNKNYIKVIVVAFTLCALWSFMPWVGYGQYSLFKNGKLCSLDWRQAEPSRPPFSEVVTSTPSDSLSSLFLTTSISTADQSILWKEETHHYIAFLTATFLIFFLIPVCIAGAFYYSIVEHVDKLNSAEVREENGNSPLIVCTWSPKHHVAKVGLGCLLVSTLPFLGYSIVCLNPFHSDFDQVHVIATPAMLARIAPLLNPFFYIWLNPEVVAIEEKLLAKLQKKRTPPAPPKTYQTINLIAGAGMSFPILPPGVPRRQLPKIPPHLLTPRSSIPTSPTAFPVTHYQNTLLPPGHHV